MSDVDFVAAIVATVIRDHPDPATLPQAISEAVDAYHRDELTAAVERANSAEQDLRACRAEKRRISLSVDRNFCRISVVTPTGEVTATGSTLPSALVNLADKVTGRERLQRW